MTTKAKAGVLVLPAASQAASLRGGVGVPDAGHFLLRDCARWHRVTAEFAIAQWSEHSQA